MQVFVQKISPAPLVPESLQILSACTSATGPVRSTLGCRRALRTSGPELQANPTPSFTFLSKRGWVG